MYHHIAKINTDDMGDLGVGGASEGVSLPPCAQVSFLVILVCPNLGAPVLHVFTGSLDTCRLPHDLPSENNTSIIDQSV